METLFLSINACYNGTVKERVQLRVLGVIIYFLINFPSLAYEQDALQKSAKESQETKSVIDDLLQRLEKASKGRETLQQMPDYSENPRINQYVHAIQRLQEYTAALEKRVAELEAELAAYRAKASPSP